MQNSLRIIRLIVCICFGFASMATYGYGLNVDDHSDDDLIITAWNCDPIFDVHEVTKWSLRMSKTDGSGVESLDEGKAVLFKSLIKFRACPDKENDSLLREAFVNAYLTFDYTETGTFGLLFGGLGDDIHTGSRYRDMIGSDKKSYVIINKVNISPTFLSEPIERREAIRKLEEQHEIEQKKLAEENAAHEEKKRQAALAQQALELRISKLKNGAISISNFDDAVLANAPKELVEVIVSPLLIPDKGVYKGVVILEEQEDENSLLVKIGWFDTLHYATLVSTKNTINYSSQSMRIGGQIKVIGRYVKNKKLFGNTMPIIEVLYFGD